jgi:hypothetical protein
MKPRTCFQCFLSLTLILGVCATLPARARRRLTAGMVLGAPDLKSGGSLAFGPEGILFIGDSQSAAVFAVDVGDQARETAAEPVNVMGIDKKLAAMLGTTPDGVLINDMAVNPTSQNIYISVSRNSGADSMPVLIRVTRKGALEEVSLSKVLFSKALLSNPPKPDAKTEWGEPARPMTITHMAFANGQLFVAGLSNEEFTSTLRRFAFPFKEDNGVESTSLEIFHTSHNRYETHAPIETFMPFHVNGKPSMLAAYGCSPLAVFPLDEMKQKKLLRGTTIAELGGGNRPIDMISFKRDGKEYVVISNSNRTMMRISSEDIDKAPAVTTGVTGMYETAGVKYVSLAATGVLQLDNLNDKFVVLINRDMQTGALNLRSFPKEYL